MANTPELNARNIRILADELKRQRSVIEEQAATIASLKNEIVTLKQELTPLTQQVNIMVAKASMNSYHGPTA